MKTLIITPQDCTQDPAGRYHHAPIICSEPTHVVLKDLKLLMIDSQPRECAIYTRGGYLNTGGGDLDTVGGYLSTRGGHLSTRGGYLDTGGGDIDTGGGYLDTGGGDIDTGGGKINGYEPPSLKIQQERLLKVREQILQNPDCFDMGDWHGDLGWRELKSCETTHCLAGWLQVLSDDETIRSMLSINAGTILAPIAVPYFFKTNTKVLDWLRGI